MARSRYFSRISSSVAGIQPDGLDGRRRCPLGCITCCRHATTWRSRRARTGAKVAGALVGREWRRPRSLRGLGAAAARARRARLDELERLHVEDALAAADDVGRAERLEELI